MNITLAAKTIETLLSAGVRDFCICAGARNSPFVMVLEESPEIRVHRFFEERSAAFFALGRIQRDGRPVAVITTSGTAVAELLPAAVEATYSHLPLILVTADRPRRYRGSGAPQAIDQIGIFSHYVEKVFDFDGLADFELFPRWCSGEWSYGKPIQVNVCFDEPLIDEGPPVLSFAEFPSVVQMEKRNSEPIHLKKPMVIAGFLTEEERLQLLPFLVRWQFPIYAESLSGLRGKSELNDLLLRGGEGSVTQAFRDSDCESVIRVGGVPTLRFWRDLEEKFLKTPVVNVCRGGYSGLSRSVEMHIGFCDLECVHGEQIRSQKLFDFDGERRRKIEEILNKFPNSEPSIIHQLGERLRSQSVYIGNSMPIREWDLCTSSDWQYERIFANRGANGIDGQVSTFLGWAKEGSENWSIVGDLTALYDLSSLWMSSAAAKGPLRIVVVNNGGGLIFKNMFQDERFLNRHSVQFQKWAEMFHWSYRSFSGKMDDAIELPERVVLEVFPNEAETTQFWQEYQSL